MRPYYLILLVAACATADKPAVPPSYQAPTAAADTYGAPAAAADSYGSPAASPAADSYGSPAAPAATQSAPDSYGSPQAPPQTDSYGSPAAPVVDEYGSPAAPAQNNYAPAAAPETAQPGNQGYYYYYYPVKQNQPAKAPQQNDDGGLIGSILSSPILLIALAISGLLVFAALAVNIQGRSFGNPTMSDMFEQLKDVVSPYATEENLSVLSNRVMRALQEYNY